MTKIIIRKRERINSSPRPGESQTWVEWQVVLGRKIVHRGGTFDEAVKHMLRLVGGSND